MSIEGAKMATTAVKPRARRKLPRPAVALSALLLSVVAVIAVFGQWLTPHNPDAQNLLASLQPPGSGHLFGTDDLGRDVLSRLVEGARPSTIGPLVVALGCAALGGSLGLVAGYVGGVVDTIISRLLDVMYALPGLLVILVLVGVLGGGYWLTAVVLIFVSFPYQTRLCRSATLAQRQLTYLDAARTLDVPRRRILFRHLLPNVAPTVLTAFLLDFVGALIGYAALDYLGFGVAPGHPDWGSMISEGQAAIAINPWISMAPALAIIVTATSATLLGDWAFDTISARSAQR